LAFLKGVKHNGIHFKLSHILNGSRMQGAIPQLPQYVSMAWYSVKKSTGTLPFTFMCFIDGLLDVRIAV